MADRVAMSRSGEMTTRVLAAGLIAASGVVHLEQYFAVHYRVIPVIGPLFVADFVLAMLIAAALLVPFARRSRLLANLVKVGAALFAAGTIVGLEISESSTLFGFHEHGYRLAIVLSLVFEGLAIVVLLASLVSRRQDRDTSAPASGAAYPTRPARTRADVATDRRT